MTEYEIRRQIAYYEDKIEYERGRIREQEKKLEELVSLGSKLGSLQKEFELKQAARKMKVALMAVLTGKCRVAKAYYDGMSGLLSGSDYKHALSGFGSSLDRVQKEKNLCDSLIAEYNGNIYRYRNTIESLRRQLAAAIAEAQAQA